MQLICGGNLYHKYTESSFESVSKKVKNLSTFTEVLTKIEYLVFLRQCISIFSVVE